jgi:hypothetical protein
MDIKISKVLYINNENDKQIKIELKKNRIKKKYE